MEVKELLAKLDETKVSLEAKAKEEATKAAKDEVALALKAINDKIEAINQLPDDLKAADLKATVKDVKELISSFDAKTKKDTEDYASLIKVTKDLTEGFDAMQLRMKGAERKEPKDFAEILKSAMEEKTDELAKMAAGEKSVKNVSIELKAVGDISTANVTGGTVWGANYKPGIIEAPKRKVHMRQVLNNGIVGAGTDFYFMAQNGAGEGGPTFVAESATKPQVDYDLVESSVKIETIATFARVTRKAMANVPGFTSFLQSRMIESLLKEEDRGILYGTGTSPEIKGILTAGNFTASTSTSTVMVEKIIDDIAKLEDGFERNATLVLMRPQQYYGFFKNKAVGSGEYDLPANVAIINGQLYISGVLCSPTTALAINTAPTPDTTDYIVGDFAMGAQFLTQESMRLEFFYEDANNVTQNKVTVRLEETVALPVYGSDYFIKGTQDVVVP
jgi:hypothetical protein